ncbi:hypothetical protein LQ384_24895 [Rhodococcus rhodochrous]|uniref:DUF541 domain-containing protein n=1 Tax=Rhodococcus rhodochrous TaxID=1829 RepID=A0AAW4XMF2_RHORH|nr:MULTISPECIES: hypothetical protein [Rhodococcus]MCD2114350.1 hypothetical protein [Rhodococcus rhodochrous]MDV6296733.1 hypothetical protein [Rhodococcus aetherivorans]
MYAYAVEIQASTGYEFKSQTFTIVVDAPKGYDQAERRGIRRAIERAAEWNAEHPEAITPRLTDTSAYRVVSIRAHVDDVAVAPATPAATPVVAGQHGATLVVAVDLNAVLDALGQQTKR